MSSRHAMPPIQVNLISNVSEESNVFWYQFFNWKIKKTKYMINKIN
jgi:hypothetical protein